MSLAAPDSAATRRPYRHRCEEFSGASITQPRQLTRYLVIGGVNVVGELNLDDGTQAVHGHPYCGTDHPALSDGRVQHTRAVLALQAFGYLENAPEVTNVLPEDDHGIVPREHRVHGGIQGLNHVHLRHGVSPARLAAVRAAERDVAACSRIHPRTSKRCRDAAPRSTCRIARHPSNWRPPGRPTRSPGRRAAHLTTRRE